ncbi:MAG: type II toxin-antitoxin system VapC family toxin [Bifidobacteriaceae bacterium]|nr:type II toxin-antitoxin system VapC family toxin [Bifidobacteriaceae bacterium]
MTEPVFVDSPVLLYAIGGEHPLRAPSRAIVRAATDGRIELHASIEAVQEVLFHRMRRGGREEAIRAAADYLDLVVCHPLNEAVMRRSLLVVTSSQIRGRDALHAATALAAGFNEIITSDADFADVPGLTAISPDLYAARLEAPRERPRSPKTYPVG